MVSQTNICIVVPQNVEKLFSLSLSLYITEWILYFHIMKSLLTTTTEIDYIRGDRVTCGVTNAVRVEMKKKNNKKQSDHALYIPPFISGLRNYTSRYSLSRNNINRIETSISKESSVEFKKKNCVSHVSCSLSMNARIDASPVAISALKNTTMKKGDIYCNPAEFSL